MRLSKENISHINATDELILPEKKLFDLPERVLQFGTGVLLRGLPDYFIDKANRQGIFNGRVVVVKSTPGSTDGFTKQDGLYTVCVRGVEAGNNVEETIVNSSISRVLTATEEWLEILACAHDPNMQIIISNTTEIGIAPSRDNINEGVPTSFPGKLLAFLFERYKAFGATEQAGLVIIPTELIIDNGRVLQAIVSDLAIFNGLDDSFITWLNTANHFCSSLVDRIVPGKLPDSEQRALEEKLGYTDELMIMTESFRLWAIESDSDRVRGILSFSQGDKGVVISADIEKFRELKLRLLNGTHTFSCGLAFLAGFNTVKEAMMNERMSSYIRELMTMELAPAIVNDHLSYKEACVFANTVLDRFRNPYLDHRWISISLNFTSKMRLRNIPLLLRHYDKNNNVPELMALGFAGYLLFMKCSLAANGLYYGKTGDKTYLMQDDKAPYFSTQWEKKDISVLVHDVLADKEIWGTELSLLKDLGNHIKENLHLLQREGVLSAIEYSILKNNRVNETSGSKST